MTVAFSCEFDSISDEVALTQLYLIKFFLERFEDTKGAIIETVNIYTENTKVKDQV